MSKYIECVGGGLEIAPKHLLEYWFKLPDIFKFSEDCRYFLMSTENAEILASFTSDFTYTDLYSQQFLQLWSPQVEQFLFSMLKETAFNFPQQ